MCRSTLPFTLSPQPPLPRALPSPIPTCTMCDSDDHYTPDCYRYVCEMCIKFQPGHYPADCLNLERSPSPSVYHDAPEAWLKGLQSYEGDCVMIGSRVHCMFSLRFLFLFFFCFISDTCTIRMDYLTHSSCAVLVVSCLTHVWLMVVHRPSLNSINTCSLLICSLAYSCWNTLFTLTRAITELISVPSLTTERS